MSMVDLGTCDLPVPPLRMSICCDAAIPRFHVPLVCRAIMAALRAHRRQVLPRHVVQGMWDMGCGAWDVGHGMWGMMGYWN